MFAFSRQLKEKIILLVISVVAQIVAAEVCGLRPDGRALRALLEVSPSTGRESDGCVQTTRNCFYHSGSRLQPGADADGNWRDPGSDGRGPVCGFWDAAGLGQSQWQTNPTGP